MTPKAKQRFQRNGIPELLASKLESQIRGLVDSEAFFLLGRTLHEHHLRRKIKKCLLNPNQPSLAKVMGQTYPSSLLALA
jgi:hypothetical protein